MIVGTSTPGFGVFLLVVSALQADPVSVKRVAFSRRYISNPAPPLLKLEFVRGWRTKLNETASIREGGGDEYCAGETRLCACAQEWVSERERERERVNAWRTEESAEKGGGLRSETETNDHEHQTTHILTQSQRYRKEDQRAGTAVHACTTGNKDDSSAC